MGHNDREWWSHGKSRVPEARATFRSAIMIANGGLMVSQEYLKLDDHGSGGLMVSQEDLMLNDHGS